MYLFDSLVVVLNFEKQNFNISRRLTKTAYGSFLSVEKTCDVFSSKYLGKLSHFCHCFRKKCKIIIDRKMCQCNLLQPVRASTRVQS